MGSGATPHVHAGAASVDVLGTIVVDVVVLPAPRTR
jgi:hypothetical protein